jgi:hypothetical protein
MQHQETVGNYYLRLQNLAKLARCTDNEELSEIYLVGLKPESLMKKVNDKRRKSDTLEKIHARAVRYETKYNEFVELQKQANSKRKENEKEKSPKPPKDGKNTPSNPKPNPTKPNNTTNSPKGNPQKNPSQKDSTQKPKPTNSVCGYCGKEHDFRECKEKYPFFHPSEIKLLLSLDRTIKPRSNWPAQDKILTKETPWIKALLEKKENTSKGETKANVQASQTNNPSANPTGILKNPKK